MALENICYVPIRVFEVEAYKLGICLKNQDMQTVLGSFTHKQKPHLVAYNDIIKALVPVFGTSGKM